MTETETIQPDTATETRAASTDTPEGDGFGKWAFDMQPKKNVDDGVQKADTGKEGKTDTNNDTPTTNGKAPVQPSADKDIKTNALEKEDKSFFDFDKPPVVQGEQNTYSQIAKELGITTEVKEQADLVKTIKEHLDTLQNKIQTPDIDTFLKDKPEQTKEIIKFLAEGGNLDDYMEPGREIDGYLKMETEALVRENMKSITNADGKPFYTEEKINKKIEKLISADTLEDEGDRIRQELITEKQNIQNEILGRQKQYKAHEAETIKNIQKQEVEMLTGALKNINDFMGGKLTEEHKTNILQNWEAGKYRETFRNPDKIARFLIFDQYGEQALKKMEDIFSTSGKETIQKRLAHIKPSIQTPSARTTQTSTAKEGDFSSWNQIYSNTQP